MMIFRTISLILLVGLVACTSAPEPALSVIKYVEPGTPGGRLCTAQCKKAHNYCKDACYYKERMCTYDMQAQAIKDYEKYVQEQFKERMTVDLRPRDFERMDQCAQPTCLTLCQRNYDRCFTKCSGKIEQRSK